MEPELALRLVLMIRLEGSKSGADVLRQLAHARRLALLIR